MVTDIKMIPCTDWFPGLYIDNIASNINIQAWKATNCNL